MVLDLLPKREHSPQEQHLYDYLFCKYSTGIKTNF